MFAKIQLIYKKTIEFQYLISRVAYSKKLQLGFFFFFFNIE